MKTPDDQIPAALLSIARSAEYIGISRAGFYEKVLPHLRTVRLGGRHLVLRESLDAFVSRLVAEQAPGEEAA